MKFYRNVHVIITFIDTFYVCDKKVKQFDVYTSVAFYVLRLYLLCDLLHFIEYTLPKASN